jgi:hypothetical protein
MLDIEDLGSSGRISPSSAGEMAEGCTPAFGLEFPN